MASITQMGGAGQPVMTVSFKMDITTSGTHNGLFITTGIQNGQQAQMKQFGFIQPNQQLPQLMDASQLSIPAATPTPTPFVTQPNAIESAREETYITKTSFPSTSGASILNDSQNIVVSPPSQRRAVTTFTNTEPSPYVSTTESIYKESQSIQTTSDRPKETTTTSTLNVMEQMQRTVSPAPSIVNRTTDEFLKNVPFKINTFSDESRPYVQHPTDMVINDTTTTTTTVEVFRANANDPTIDYYKLPPPPADQHGRGQLIPTRGPAYEVHTNTETRFSDAPIGYSAISPSPYLSAPAQKSVQWDTRTPITILKDDRPDSRYGSHGSIDTILRKQWIENKTETLSPNANDLYGQSSFRGSNRSLVEQPRESTSYTFLDTQATQAIQPRPESALRKEPERRYTTQTADHQKSPVVQSGDSRSRHFEKRRRSPHNSLSPARRQQTKSTTPRSPNSNRRHAESSRSHRSRLNEEVQPRQSWEYSSIQKPARSNQARSYQSQTGTQQVPYTIIPQRQRHRSASQLPTLQAAEDYVERPPRQTCVPFRPVAQTTTYSTRQRSRSKSPPPLATEYGKPTLVYTPRNPNDSSFIEDDYYGRLREEQVRTSRSRERKSSLAERSRSPSPWEWERPQSPNYRMGNRSASSNEIFRLYQTRDCLGNVLYELDPAVARAQYNQIHRAQMRPKAHWNLPARKERPVSQHSYQTISNRSSRNLEDAKFDEYNNVRLVADGAKLHIVQEGKV